MKADRLIVPRWIFDLWRYQITPAGKIVLGGLILSGIGAVSILIPVYIVFFVLFFVSSFARLVGFLLRPRVDVRGELPMRTRVGQIVRVDITLTNRSRLPVYDLMLGFVGLPLEIEHLNRNDVWPYLAGRGSAQMTIELRFGKRGQYAPPPLRPHTTFPFHLIRNGFVHHEIGSILVLPEFHPLSDIDMPLGTKYQPGGVALTSHVGESPEYIGNRDYVPGDSARRLDFRSWARTGKPVVKEYQEEYYCRIAIVLDTWAPKPEGGLIRRDVDGRILFPFRFGDDGLLRIGRDAFDVDDDSFESAVSLTAAIGDVLSDGEYLIDLFAAGPELYVFRSGRHTAHFENLLEILACVEATESDPVETLIPAISEELHRVSTAVCVFQSWDAGRQMLCRTILESGCSLKVIIVGESTDETFMPGDVHDFRQLTSAEIRSGRVEAI